MGRDGEKLKGKGEVVDVPLHRQAEKCWTKSESQFLKLERRVGAKTCIPYGRRKFQMTSGQPGNLI